MEAEDLRKLLELAVLYDAIEVTDVEEVYQDSFAGRSGRTIMRPARIVQPRELRLFCANEKCSDVMDWDLSHEGQPIMESQDLSGGYSALEYRCRHTPEEKVVFFLSRTYSKERGSVVQLVGREPRSTPYLSDELRKALSEHDRHMYANALDCRARGLGIAALLYMRRVVEAEMDRIIDLIVEALPDDTDVDVREALVRLKGAYQFAEKAAVADARLPDSFFPGNQNPFTRLHDLTSDGVHNLDDVESSERFDECQELFEMLFQKLFRDRQTQRLYRERLTSLKRKSRT